MSEPEPNERKKASTAESEANTDRSKEREEEDRQSVPVIIKRTDESRRHPDDTLEQAVHDGLEQINRRALSLLLSAVAAGMILEFTALLVGVVAVAVRPLAASDALVRIATALVYPIGYIICILSGSQLFTEHTATSVYPVLDGKASVGRLLRLWMLVIIGNLLGTAFGAGLLTVAEPVIQARDGYEYVARHVVNVETWPLLASAVLSGWLMALAAWLVLASPHVSGQILCIYVVTFVIGVGGLHHSIAGSTEWLVALFLGNKVTLAEGIRFTSMALFGNMIGGSIFVATLNYVHIRGSQPSE